MEGTPSAPKWLEHVARGPRQGERPRQEGRERQCWSRMAAASAAVTEPVTRWRDLDQWQYATLRTSIARGRGRAHHHLNQHQRGRWSNATASEADGREPESFAADNTTTKDSTLNPTSSIGHLHGNRKCGPGITGGSLHCGHCGLDRPL